MPLRLLDTMRTLLQPPVDSQQAATSSPVAAAVAAASAAVRRSSQPPAAASMLSSDSDDADAEATAEAAAAAAAELAEADPLSDADLTSAARLAGMQQSHDRLSCALHLPRGMLRRMFCRACFVDCTGLQQDSNQPMSMLRSLRVSHSVTSYLRTPALFLHFAALGPGMEPQFRDPCQCGSVALAEKVTASMPELNPDILQRRCPRRQRAAGAVEYAVRVTTRKRLPPYALKVHCTILSCTSHSHMRIAYGRDE